MRMSVINQLSGLQGKLLGFVGVLSYQYCQLCVKAEASALLAIEEQVGSNSLKIEDMAGLLTHEDEEENKDKMDLLPKNGDYIPVILKGVLKAHPEFKVSTLKYDEKGEDNADNTYIRLTMPEVDKDRRKLILDSIDVLYDKCKVDMDACMAKATAEITKLTIDDDPSALDEAKQKIDGLKKQFVDLRESLTEDKKKEVEEAYQRYQNKQTSADALKKQNGNDGKTSAAEEMPDETDSTDQPLKKQQTETPETKGIAKKLFEAAGQSISME